MDNKLANVWLSIINDKTKSWVAFENGTCVVLMNPEENLEKQAQELLAQYGAVHAGTPSGDFTTMKLTDFPGWVVLGHHPDILNYVSPDEFDDDASPDDLTVGLLGRHHRSEDASSLNVIYTNDQR